VPFFDHAGREIEREEVKSIHVLTPRPDVLSGNHLQSCLKSAGYASQVVDPSDFRPFSDAPLVDIDLLVSSQPEVLASLPLHRSRASLLNHPGIVLVDLVTECPFNAVEVMGPLEGLESTFGSEGIRMLRGARTLYAINVPKQASPLAARILQDLAKLIAREVSGEILELK
jgi:hypothetical protein